LELQTKGATTEDTETLKSVLDAKKDELSALKGKSSGSVNFVLKAVGNMALTTNTTGQIPQAEREAGITRIVRRQPYILDLVNVGTIMSNLWEWVEQKNQEGGSAMTAEGAKKSQTDFDLVLASASVKKVTAFIKVTKEMLDDVNLLRAEIDQELTELINLRIDDQVLSGVGTGDNLTGIMQNATAWAAGSFALSVPTPNNADVLRVAINQAMVNQFQPNYIVLHPSDATAMDLDKGSDGHYALPPFATIDGRIISGVPVVMNTGQTQGTFLVGDFTKSAVRFKEGLTINVGYENDDFTKNFVTILAEARLVHRVKSNHYGAFIKGTFSAAITALTKA
jgi:HK97 family phage major capsid protein